MENRTLTFYISLLTLTLSERIHPSPPPSGAEKVIRRVSLEIGLIIYFTPSDETAKREAARRYLKDPGCLKQHFSSQIHQRFSIP